MRARWVVVFGALAACAGSGGKTDATPHVARVCSWRDCAESAPTSGCIEYCSSSGGITRMSPMDAGGASDGRRSGSIRTAQ